MKGNRGFTLLEVLVATLIMGLAVAGVLSGLSAATRNAARLTDYDRATLLARQKMDELLVDHKIPRGPYVEGSFDKTVSGGADAGWRARVTPFESATPSIPGSAVIDRIELEIWWMTGATRHSFSLEGFRRGVLQPGETR